MLCYYQIAFLLLFCFCRIKDRISSCICSFFFLYRYTYITLVCHWRALFQCLSAFVFICEWLHLFALLRYYFDIDHLRMIGLHRLNCTFESVSVDLSYVYHALKLPNTSRHDKQIQTNWNDYEAIFHVCVCVYTILFLHHMRAKRRRFQVNWQ